MKLYFAALRLLLAAAALGTMSFSFAQDCKNLPAVSELLRSDQEDIRNIPIERWSEVKVNRAARQAEVGRIIACNEMVLASDWHKAAIIMAQSSDEGNLFKAMEYANRAFTIDPQSKASKKIIANAWDKLMQRRGQDQWFGTQYKNDKPMPIAHCVISNQTRREYQIDEEIIASQPESCPENKNFALALGSNTQSYGSNPAKK